MIFFIRTAVVLPVCVLLVAACGQKGPLFLPKDAPERPVKKPTSQQTQPELPTDDTVDYPASGN